VTTKRAEGSRRLAEAEVTIEQLFSKSVAQTQQVDLLTAWLDARRLSNGLGQDFEWTLSQPRKRKESNGS